MIKLFLKKSHKNYLIINQNKRKRKKKRQIKTLKTKLFVKNIYLYLYYRNLISTFIGISYQLFMEYES